MTHVTAPAVMDTRNLKCLCTVLGDVGINSRDADLLFWSITLMIHPPPVKLWIRSLIQVSVDSQWKHNVSAPATDYK